MDKAEIIDNLRTVLDFDEDPALRKRTEKLTRERDAVAWEANEAISQNARVAQDQDEYNERYAELVREYDQLESEIKRLEREAEGQKAKKRRIGDFIRALETAEEKFSVDDWCIMVEKVTVFREKMVFTLTSGAEIEA